MNKLIKFLVILASILTFGSLLFIISYILINGIPNIKPSLFALEYNSENVSLFPSIITTIFLIIMSLFIAGPIGIFTSIYLVEYSNKNSIIVDLVRIATDTLSGIPSIVYGLFGMLFFVVFLGFNYSLLSGALTLAIMILPLIIRSTEEALMAVDDSLREASFGLGAGKLRTITKIIIPSAMPGILSGIILSIGRVIGETAALIFTLGTVAKIPTSLFDSGRTLSLHMYLLSTEGLYINESYATGVILLIIIFIINWLSTYFSNKLGKGYDNE